MRLDYILYILAVVFFVITITSAFLLTGTDQILWISASALLGILSLSLGFIQRPKPAQTNQSPTPAPTPAIATSATQPTETAILEAPKEEEKLSLQTAPTTETPIIQEPQVTVQPAMPETPANTVASIEVNEPSIEHALTEISGIGEKRASQLKALGIKSVDDLAKAPVEDLAKSLKVSPKIVAKWVTGAKKLQQK